MQKEEIYMFLNSVFNDKNC